MTKYFYECDAGSLQVGNEQFTALFPNGYGDGRFQVFVDCPPARTKNTRLVGCVEGHFNVYAYDCDKDDVLCTIEGRYGVFCDNGTMLLEKWQ